MRPSSSWGLRACRAPPGARAALARETRLLTVLLPGLSALTDRSAPQAGSPWAGLSAWVLSVLCVRAHYLTCSQRISMCPPHPFSICFPHSCIFFLLKQAHTSGARCGSAVTSAPPEEPELLSQGPRGVQVGIHAGRNKCPRPAVGFQHSPKAGA